MSVTNPDTKNAILKNFEDLEISKTGMIKTANRRGYMVTDLDFPTQKFIEFAKSLESPVLEIGCAYGFVTHLLLNENVKVIANDIDKTHLDSILRHTPAHLNHLLKTVQGFFPADLDFPDHSLGCVLASRVCHFLTGDQLEEGFKNLSMAQAGWKIIYSFRNAL